MVDWNKKFCQSCLKNKFLEIFLIYYAKNKVNVCSAN
jgi:hypothetical protein